MSNDGLEQFNDIKKKNRKKAIRTVLQLIVCTVIVVGVTLYLCFPKEYVEPDKSTWTQRDGFITLSYVGVARKSNADLVSKDNLDKHLKALYEAGYVTIDMNDVIDFYENGAPLPDKALLLIFEDGRRDSMIFGQSILEKYNFKAVMMNYAGNIVNKDRLFLKEDEIKELEESSYWEIGSNGYRFSYINVKEIEDYVEDADGDGKYDENKIEYNHYLMDYLRDEDGVPVETKEEMIERITWDYEKMNEIYTDVLGYDPAAYMIMHANSIYGNMNKAVEKVNVENINKYFKVLFNREGSCYNTSKDSLNNLTRMQVGADWSVNKLLMEINNWTNNRTPFVLGDEESVNRWHIQGGVIEADGTEIIFTAPQAQKAFALLKGSSEWNDIDLSVYLAGREFGTQSVYLRYDNENSYVKLSVRDNKISIREKAPGAEERELYSGPMPDSEKLPENNDNFSTDRINGNEVENNSMADTKIEDFDIKKQISKKYKTHASHMASPVSWNITVRLLGDELSVYVGGEVLVENMKIDSGISYGGVAIECNSNEGKVYDGIFDELTVTPIVAEEEQETVGE